MPGVTGGDLVKQLKEKRPKLPVIMMTGHSEIRFLRKPVSKEVISRVIRELL